MLLCRTWPLPRKSGKTTGCNLFAGLTCSFTTLHAKSCDALPALLATIVLPDFARSFPAGKKRYYARKHKTVNPEIKSAQRHDRKAGRVYGLWVEAFFCLDLLVTFGSSQK